MDSKILIIDCTDFISFPIGGTLVFDKQLLKVIPPSDVALVGITTNNVTTGHWTYIEIDNKRYEYFPILKVLDTNKKPIIPLRIKSLFALLWYLPKIRKRKYYFVFSQTPQFLFALNRKKWESICFCFAGVSNSVSLSRYNYLRFLGTYYERILFSIINKHVDITLAAADSFAIDELVKRSNGVLNRNNIHSFPTRFDSSVFRPLDKFESRRLLDISSNKLILLVVGRLSWVKGWDLLIAMIRLDKNDQFKLIFVGDGEDRLLIEASNSDLINSGKIEITGFIQQEQVVRYINVADVVLVASYHEGWSTSMLETLACGKPLVSTNVSGAADLIKVGENGFILYNRNPLEFFNLIKKAVLLTDAERTSLEISAQYSIDTLYHDLISKWKLF